MAAERVGGARWTSRTVDVDGLALRVLDAGPPDAPPVVLLHGLRSYAHTWDTLADVLAASHRLLALDFRGRGASDWDPQRRYTTPTYVADVEAVVEALGLDRFAVVGHSMGGTVGYALAAAHPDRVTDLVVEDIGPGSSTDSPGAARILREVGDPPESFDNLEGVEAYWRALRPGITDEALASRVEHTVRQGDDGRWHWRLDMAGIAAARRGGDPAGPVDLWACVEALRCPTLVIRGGCSDFLSAGVCREMAARQPLLRWAEVAGAGHYVHDDDPQTFADLVREALAGTT